MAISKSNNNNSQFMILIQSFISKDFVFIFNTNV